MDDPFTFKDAIAVLNPNGVLANDNRTPENIFTIVDYTKFVGEYLSSANKNIFYQQINQPNYFLQADHYENEIHEDTIVLMGGT